MDYIIKHFLDEIVDELKRVNESDERINNQPLDIPFIMSVIYQHIEDKKFTHFINDIKHNEYQIVYEDTPNNYHDYGQLNIGLYSNNENSKTLNYTYTIILSYDERYWGYCQCSPNDKDYDSRHGCCGHGCDWSAPAFAVIKNTMIGESSWCGDEHDYWNFEDNFYKSKKELAIEKEKKDKEDKIKDLKDSIEKAQNELNSLLKD